MEEKVMGRLKQAVKMLRYNFSSIAFFEVVYRVLSLAILTPAMYGLLNLSMNIAGISYLSSGTIHRYMRSPITYVTFLLMLILISFFLLVNLSGIIFSMEASVRREKLNPMDILLHGIANACRSLAPKNLLTLGYVLFILPFTYSLTLSGTLLGLKLPEFLMHFLKSYKFGLMGALAIYLVLCVTFFRQIFTLNYFVLYKVSYRQARRMSNQAMKNHVLLMMIGVIGLNLSIAVVAVLLEGAFAAGISKVVMQIVPNKTVFVVVDTVFRAASVILYVLIVIVTTPLIHAYICAHFYEREGDMEYEEFKKLHLSKMQEREEKLLSDRSRKKQHTFLASAVAFGLILNGCYVYLSTNNYMSFRIAYPTNASVTAHRGDAGKAPENTMPAFEQAVEDGADIIELDVRQTKDGVYIIMHDESLYRTANVRHKVGEVDYDYISKLDVGSYFDRSYDGTHIPTLEEVLIFAKENDVFLNIELKPADTDQNYVQGIVDLLHEYDFVDQCMLGSQSVKALREAKELDPEISTLYIMTMAFGDFAGMQGIDGFSIKHTYISNNMVSKIHAKGKKIYAWTVNNEAYIKDLLLLDVDGIITDNPAETKEIIVNANDSIIEDWMKRIIYKY